MNVTVRDPLAPRRQMPPIVIGRAGEYGATTVTFDLRGLIDRYGAGMPTLLHKRPPDDEAYIVPLSAADTETHDRTEMPDPETLVWHVGQVATSYVGNGKIELQWHPEGAAKKSAQFDVVVLGTIGNPVSEIPDAQQIYLDVMQGIADDAEDAADRAEEAVSHYPRIQNGTWWVWDAANSEWVDTGVSARGPVGPVGAKGETGFSPEIRVTDITGGHKVDVYNELGFESFDVMDGTDGADGEDGTDGVSPTVTITAIEGGHRVTITDAEHPSGQTFDVMDGEDASGAADAVLYTQQTLTPAQQEQARKNISAPAKTVFASLLVPILRECLYGTDQSDALDTLEAALSDQVETFTIQNVLTNVTTSNSAAMIISGAAYHAVLTPDSGTEMSAVTVTMGGVDITATAYANGIVSISSVTDDVAITATAQSVIDTVTPELIDGYISPTTGTIGGTSSYRHTAVIPVREGDKVYGVCNDSQSGATVNGIPARWTAAYDNNGTFLKDSGVDTQSNYKSTAPYIVPSGVYGVVFSLTNRYANNVVVTIDKSERVVS